MFTNIFHSALDWLSSALGWLWQERAWSIAAIIAIVMAILKIKKYRAEKLRIKLSLRLNMVYVFKKRSMNKESDEKLVVMTIRNFGQKPVHIAMAGANAYGETGYVFKDLYKWTPTQRVLDERQPTIDLTAPQRDFDFDSIDYFFAQDSLDREYRLYIKRFGRLRYLLKVLYRKILKPKDRRDKYSKSK